MLAALSSQVFSVLRPLSLGVKLQSSTNLEQMSSPCQSVYMVMAPNDPVPQRHLKALTSTIPIPSAVYGLLTLSTISSARRGYPAT